jgi:stage II sporulation protein D
VSSGAAPRRPEARQSARLPSIPFRAPPGRRGPGRLAVFRHAVAAGVRRALLPLVARLRRLPFRRRHLALALSAVVALLCAALVVAAFRRAPESALGGDLVRVKLDSVRGEPVLEFAGANLTLDGAALGATVRLTRGIGSIRWQSEGRSGTTPLPCELGAAGLVTLARRKGPRHYPAPLRFAAGGEWTVVVQVPLEDYVAGVVAGELGPRFAPAALAAQAVAARSYAASFMAAAPRRDHHLLDTARSQVFTGLGVDRCCVDAARATRGLLLSSQGRVLRAYYSSTCGGATAASRDKFSDVPAAVFPCQPCEDCRLSPVWRWQEDATPDELLAALPAVEPPITAIAPETVDAAGRWLTARVQGRKGSATLPGWELRRLLRLRSDFLDSVQVEGGRLRVLGRGFGHGVGLCQWGAEGMARRGADWRAILQRYFPGAVLVAADRS